MKKALVFVASCLIFATSVSAKPSDFTDPARLNNVDVDTLTDDEKDSLLEALFSEYAGLYREYEDLYEETAGDVADEADEGNESADTTLSSDMTAGQRNAIAKADSYLSFTAFSYSGLVEQLEYEGFSTEDATFAADNCGADWNEQAYKKAQQYLEFTSFSLSGLIDQLEYEGFTPDQASYGAEKAYNE